MTNMCKAKKDIELYGVVRGNVFSYEVTEKGTYNLSHGEKCTKDWFDEHYEIINENGETNINNTKASRGNTAGRKGKRVICLETNEIFQSATEAAIKYECGVKAISKVCLGMMKTAKGKTFRYLDTEHNVPLSVPEAPVTDHEITLSKPAKMLAKGKRCNGNTNAVVNITKAKAYSSCTDAAEDCAVTVGHMSMVCRSENSKAKGNRCFYVRDLPEHFEEVLEAFSKAVMYDELHTKEEKRKELLADVEKHKANIASIEEQIGQLYNALRIEEVELEKAKETLMYFN